MEANEKFKVYRHIEQDRIYIFDKKKVVENGCLNDTYDHAGNRVDEIQHSYVFEEKMYADGEWEATIKHNIEDLLQFCKSHEIDVKGFEDDEEVIIESIEEFIKENGEKECNCDTTYVNYFDGSNWATHILKCELYEGLCLFEEGGHKPQLG
ncbi:MAG: hypothetical protein LBU03_06095 [Tannerellaceae bacterium]|jgi:hypothetical protein|nr:hypothetical protein [Tannerellaceae bacterium]